MCQYFFMFINCIENIILQKQFFGSNQKWNFLALGSSRKVAKNDIY